MAYLRKNPRFRGFQNVTPSQGASILGIMRFQGVTLEIVVTVQKLINPALLAGCDVVTVQVAENSLIAYGGVGWGL